MRVCEVVCVQLSLCEVLCVQSKCVCMCVCVCLCVWLVSTFFCFGAEISGNSRDP